MPRTARIIENNNFYHVISRSLNDVFILKDNEDFRYFMSLIHSAKKKYPFRLFHYVIMNTHFHFIVQALSPVMLSKGLAHIKWFYTHWSKKKYNWKGPLWQQRYKSIPIENENYLYNCGMYVELNPVRAKICENPEDYEFSSYKKYHMGVNDILVDNYEFDVQSGQRSSTDYHIDYQSDFATKLFSRTSAIGSPFFIAAHKDARPQK